jgi:hypothetical protein
VALQARPPPPLPLLLRALLQAHRQATHRLLHRCARPPAVLAAQQAALQARPPPPLPLLLRAVLQAHRQATHRLHRCRLRHALHPPPQCLRTDSDVR